MPTNCFKYKNKVNSVNSRLKNCLLGPLKINPLILLGNPDIILEECQVGAEY